MDHRSRINENVAAIRARMAAAAARSGRSADAVRLVAVTKYIGLEEIQAIVATGCTDLGESRPQQLWERSEALHKAEPNVPVRWHMIGHLQRNKVERTLPLVDLIHSLDSLRLAAAIDKATGELSRRAPVLLEVNVSGEAAKHGFSATELESRLDDLAKFRNLEIRGLMCMAGLEGNLDDARREFATLRKLRDRLRKNCPTEMSLNELSMGMSGDFEVAIEEGATIVRIGSALYEV